jgi:DNA-binding MarR family transcriptional regulator
VIQLRVPERETNETAETAERAESEALGQVLDRLGTWVRRVTPPAEWSSTALSSLDRLVRGGALRITDLCAMERISQPGMTGLVSRMETAGLVTRRPDPSDGRATLVSVTDAGASYLSRMHAARSEAVAAQVERLCPAHRRALANAAEALQALADLSKAEELSRV